MVVDATAVHFGEVVLHFHVGDADSSFLQVHAAATACRHVFAGIAAAVGCTIINNVGMAHGDVFGCARFAHAEDAATAAFIGFVALDEDAFVPVGAVDSDFPFMRVEAAAVEGGRVVGDLRGNGFRLVGVDIDVAVMGVDAAAVLGGRVAIDDAIEDGDPSLIQVDATTVLGGRVVFHFETAQTDIVGRAGVSMAINAAAVAVGGLVVVDFDAVIGGAMRRTINDDTAVGVINAAAVLGFIVRNL